MAHPPQIPLTPQTDERNFPKWQQDAPPGQSGHAYPKMLTRICTAQDRSDWLEANKRFDIATHQPYWENVPPRVGAPIPIVTTEQMVSDGLCSKAGEPIIAADFRQEEMFRAHLGGAQHPAPEITHIPVAADGEWLSQAPAKKRARKPRRREAA